MNRLQLSLLVCAFALFAGATGQNENPTTPVDCPDHGLKAKLQGLDIKKVNKTAGGDEYYHYHVTSMKNWTEAKEWCHKRGMELATPKTKKDLLEDVWYYRNKKSDYYWLGAQHDNDTSFVWIDKTKIEGKLWEPEESMIKPRINVAIDSKNEGLKGTCAYMSAPEGYLWYTSCNTLHFFTCQVPKGCGNVVSALLPL